MNCSQCGREIDGNALFCPFCGAKTSGGAPADNGPIFQAEVKTLLKSGRLIVYRDRTEFVASSVEKKVFHYASLIAVKKGRDRIDFIMEDGRTESCQAKGEALNKGFFLIEQAAQPYIEKNKSADGPRGIRYKLHIVPPKLNSLVSGLLSGKSEGGMLYLLDDSAEYHHSTGTSETIPYSEVKAAYVSGKTVKFRTYNETYRAFGSGEDIPEGVAAFLNAAIAPYVRAHREALLNQGIYFQFCRENSRINVYKDKIESFSPYDGEKVIPYEDVRAFSIFAEQMEVCRTDATSLSFNIDSEEGGELKAFLEEALAPYIALRTEGFDRSFGSDERIEFNESRQTVHFIRQDGKEITKEYPMASLAAAEVRELAMDGITNAVLGNLASGLNGQETTEERLKEINVTFDIPGAQNGMGEVLRLGSFPLGLTRSNPKYGRITDEISDLFAYLEEKCPACETIRPELPEPLPLGLEAEERAPEQIEGAVRTPVPEAAEPLPVAERTLQKNQFGTLIDGLTNYIATCDTPMTIAIQGDWDSGAGSFMRLIYEAIGPEQNALWLNTWQFDQVEKGQLPILLADKLINLLGGVNTEEVKDKATKVIKGIMSFTPGGDKALDVVDVFRNKNAAASFENQVRQFSDLVASKGGRAVVFVDDLNRLAPGRLTEMLDALSFFFPSRGCIFVASVEQSAVIRGKREVEGPAFSEEQGRRYFNELFKMPFNVPKASLDVRKYMVDNLGRIGVATDNETEVSHYTRLAVLSVGAEPKALDRLMNSFLLLRSMSGGELLNRRSLELMLFALLCMQSSFHPAYSYMVQVKDRIDAAFLNGLCGENSEVVERSGLEEEKNAGFREFAAEFCQAVSTDGVEGISDEECRTFVKALNISAVTAK